MSRQETQTSDEALRLMWGQNPIFAAAGAEVCSRLAGRYPPRRHEVGEVVFDEGDTDVGLFVLLSGTVRIFHRTPDGRELIIKLLRAPAVFGDIEVFHDLPYLESVDAVDASLVARIPSRDYMELLLSHPAAMLEELRSITAAFCVAARNERHPFTTLEQRVANLLLSYADFFGEGDQRSLRVDHPLSQKAIARQLGATERAVAQVVGAWTKQGVLRKEGRRTLILSPRRLEDLARPIRHGICYYIGMPLSGLTARERPVKAVVEVVQGAGSQTGRRYRVHQELLVGRRPPCRLLVSDELTSEQHCRIFRSKTGSRFWIEDLESVNGTYVNARSVRRKVLRDGDRVTLGAIELLVHVGADD